MDEVRQNQLWWLNLVLLLSVSITAFLLYSQFASLHGWQDLFNIGLIYLFLAVGGMGIVLLAGFKFAFFSSIGITTHQKIIEDLAIRLRWTKEIFLAVYLIGGMIFGFLSTVAGKLFIQNLIFAPKLAATLDTTTSAFTTTVVAPVFEEYAFRGAIMPTMEKYLAAQFIFGRSAIGIHLGNIASFLIAWVSQAAMWSAWHFTARIRTPAELPALFFFGLFLGAIVRITNNLLPALGAHLVLNIVNQ